MSLYDPIARSYDRRNRNPTTLQLRLRERSLLRRFLKPRMQILDAGCGTGFWAGFAAPKSHWTGADPSAEMLKIAKGKYKKVVQAPAEKLPFPDSSFDAAIAFFTVLNLADPLQAAKELVRVTKPGGVILVSAASIYDQGLSFNDKKTVPVRPITKRFRLHGIHVKMKLFTRGELWALFGRFGCAEVSFEGLFVRWKPRWGSYEALNRFDVAQLGEDRAGPAEYGAVYVAAFQKYGKPVREKRRTPRAGASARRTSRPSRKRK